MESVTNQPVSQAHLSDDPRTQGIDAEFQQLVSQIARAFGQIAQVRGRRATHSYGTTAQGVLRVLDSLTIPEHNIFLPGKEYAVLLRHANIKGFRDDAILDGRGATVRILDDNIHTPLSKMNLHESIVDILMSTGRNFILGDAVSFGQWVASSMPDRAKMLQTFPQIVPIFSEIIRDPESYTQLHYYSETTYNFTGLNNESFFLRYRLVNQQNPTVDTGSINPKYVKMPLDFLPRVASDTRPENYLQADFRQKVRHGGVSYLLQMQLQPITESIETNERAKDCTIPWEETAYPFHDVAVLALDSILPDELAEPLEFNPYHAPPELGLILAKTAREKASVNHLRSIVYQISANMRKYQTTSSELVEWGTAQPLSLQDQYPYGPATDKSVPSFDASKPLPARVQSKPRYLANFGLHLIPAQKLAPTLPELGITGVLDLMGSSVASYMPPNLTRTRLDKFSDEFFVERRLNGFNPGKFRQVSGQPWQYTVAYDCSKFVVEPSGLLPSYIEARFTLCDRSLHPHSIQFTLSGQTETQKPGDSDWEWGKRLFRCAEFVFQEIQSHLGRTHMNMDQYAMAYYRNVVNNPIRLLLEPHWDGLLNINKLGAKLIKGEEGFIPEASSLAPKEVDAVLREEVSSLSYKNWSPHAKAIPDPVFNNHYDPAAIAFWDILTQYVGQFFIDHQEGIAAHWTEIEHMSADLVSHSILDPKLGTLAIQNVTDLQRLCVYAMYHSSFFHSWVNNKQYEDGGDVSYSTIGLWDTHHPAYNPLQTAQREAKQVSLLWTLSSVRYNPIMDVGPAALKDAIWKNRHQIEPGIPISDLMMSINI
jgi:linolenate 9R-lipoxygenase